MQQHFLGVCFKTNSQYIPSLVSPKKEKKEKKTKQEKKKYIQEPILFRYSRRCVYTRNFSPGFVCYEICMPQYQMWPGSNARRMQQVFDPGPRQHWVSIIAQLQQKIFSLRILAWKPTDIYIYTRFLLRGPEIKIARTPISLILQLLTSACMILFDVSEILFFIFNLLSKLSLNKNTLHLV